MRKSFILLFIFSVVSYAYSQYLGFENIRGYGSVDYYCLNGVVYISTEIQQGNFINGNTKSLNPLIKNNKGDYWDCNTFVKENKHLKNYR